jgi:hypothetical protein
MQIPLSDWPVGLSREIATICAASVTDNLGTRLIFERDHDDLDAFSAAVFTIGETRFALQLYDNIPTRDFTLIVSNDALDDQFCLEAFLSWSGVPESAVAWRRPRGNDCQPT